MPSPVRIADVVDGVRVALAGGSFSAAFTPVRRYLPKLDLDQVNGLEVSVVGQAMTREDATRGAVWKEVGVGVGIQKRLANGTNPEDAAANAELDALTALAEEVADFFTPNTQLSGLDGCRWLRTSHDPVYVPEHLDNRVFTSVVTVTFKILHQRS